MRAHSRGQSLCGRFEMPAEVEQGELADLLAGAFGGNEAIGEIGFAGGFVSGRGLADEHRPRVVSGGSIRQWVAKILWHYK